LGRDPFTDGSLANVWVEGRVELAGAGYVARIVLRDRESSVLGTRAVESPDPDCSVATETLALVLALMIDLPEDEVPERPLRVPERRHEWTVEVSTSFVAVMGLAETPAIGAQLVASLEWTSLFPIELWGRAVGLGRFDAGGRGAELAAYGAGIRLCPRIVGEPMFSLRLCGGVGASEILASGFGHIADRTSRAWVGVIEARGILAFIPVKYLVLRIEIAGELPLPRPRIVENEGTVVGESWVMTPSVALGVGIVIDG
jgi:hypothetical protein